MDVFPFLLLPTEIRQLIYEYALTDPRVILEPQCPWRSGPRQILMGLGCGLFPSCRQIYHEAIDVFYGKNIIRYYPSPISTSSFMKHTTCSEDTLRQLRRIEIPSFHWLDVNKACRTMEARSALEDDANSFRWPLAAPKAKLTKLLFNLKLQDCSFDYCKLDILGDALTDGLDEASSEHELYKSTFWMALKRLSVRSQLVVSIETAYYSEHEATRLQHKKYFDKQISDIASYRRWKAVRVEYQRPPVLIWVFVLGPAATFLKDKYNAHVCIGEWQELGLNMNELL